MCERVKNRGGAWQHVSVNGGIKVAFPEASGGAWQHMTVFLDLKFLGFVEQRP